MQHTRSTRYPQGVADWQAHAYEELGSVLAEVQEYDRPDELAARLGAIAHDLRESFSAPLVPSSRLEINDLPPHYRLSQKEKLIAKLELLLIFIRNPEPLDQRFEDPILAVRVKALIKDVQDRDFD